MNGNKRKTTNLFNTTRGQRDQLEHRLSRILISSLYLSLVVPQCFWVTKLGSFCSIIPLCLFCNPWVGIGVFSLCLVLHLQIVLVILSYFVKIRLNLMIEQCRCCGCKIPRRRNMGSGGLVIFKIILKLFYLGQIFRFTQCPITGN